MPRKTRSQNKHKKILILPEGQSELLYLKLVTSEYRPLKRNLTNINNKPFKNLEEITKEVKRLAKEYRDRNLPYDEIHIICDKESLSNKSRQKSYQNLEKEKNIINNAVKETEIKIISSFPTFEFFLILHFKKIKNFKKLHTDKSLKEILSNQHIKYKKANKKWLETTVFNKNAKENIVLAIERSSKIKTDTDNNSWSNLHKTIEQIICNAN